MNQSAISEDECRKAKKAVADALSDFRNASFDDGFKAGWKAAIEDHERAELARLKEKYEGNSWAK